MAVFPFPGEDTVLAGVDRALWAELLGALAGECGEGDWHKYSKNAAWSWRAKREGRTIVYLLPGADGVTASFALGAAAVAQVREAGGGFGRVVGRGAEVRGGDGGAGESGRPGRYRDGFDGGEGEDWGVRGRRFAF